MVNAIAWRFIPKIEMMFFILRPLSLNKIICARLREAGL
jgi:hypothetical protein